MGKAESISSIIWSKAGCLLSPLRVNRVLKFLTKTLKQTTDKIRWTQTRKEEVSLLLSVDYLVPYRKDPVDSTRKLSDLINTFSKVADTKSTYRNHQLLYLSIINSTRKKLEKAIEYCSKPEETLRGEIQFFVCIFFW